MITWRSKLRRERAHRVWNALVALAWGACAYAAGRYQPWEYDEADGWNTQDEPWLTSWDGK